MQQQLAVSLCCVDAEVAVCQSAALFDGFLASGREELSLLLVVEFWYQNSVNYGSESVSPYGPD